MLRLLLVTYVLGGLTFVPLLCSLLIYVTWRLSPPAQLSRNVLAVQTKKAEEYESKTIKSGWLTARRTFEPLPDEGSYVKKLTSGYRSFIDNRSGDPRRMRQKDTFYAVLKQTATSNVLFLYDSNPAAATDAQPVDCWAAIDVTLHDCITYPSQGVIDGELWMKKTAVVLKQKTSDASSVDANKDLAALEGTTDSLEPGQSSPWFLFAAAIIDKEDWYFALLEASRGYSAKDKSMFDPADMASLISNIDDQPDSIPTRWLNAMIGRLFLSVYKTHSVEQYIVDRIVRKLAKVNKPNFLSEIRVREVNVGKTTPFFGKPMLKELTEDGDASMEVQVSYKGEFRITVSTVATITLASRKYEVALVLAIVLNGIEGTLAVKLKKPPSNRFWYGFTAMPKMDLHVEPVVSDRQIKWSMILKPIESRIREVIAESIVAPNYDDLAFFDTMPHSIRAGILGEAARRNEELATAAPDPAAEEGISIDIGNDSIDEQDEASVGESGLRKRNLPPAHSSSGIFSTRSPATSIASAPLPDAVSSQQEKQHNRKKSWFASSIASVPSASSFRPRAPSTSSSSSTLSKSMPASATPPVPDLPAQLQSDSPPERSAADQLRGVLQNDERKSAAVMQKSGSHSGPSSRRSSMASHSPERRPAFSIADPVGIYASPNTSGETLPVEPPTISTPPSDPVTAPMEELTPRVSLKASNPSLRSVSPSQASSVPDSSSAETSARDHLPSVASSPIVSQRAASIHSHNSGASSSNVTLLESLKAKAADKEALQASVTQARDAMKRWGAGWGKKDTPADKPIISSAVRDVGLAKPQAGEEASKMRKVPPPHVSAAQFSSTSAVTSPIPEPGTSASSASSLSSNRSNTSTPPRMSPSLSSGGYMPAPTMALPGKIRNPGGLGSAGPEQLTPQRPGDLPPDTPDRSERGSLLTSAIRTWTTSPPADASSKSSSSARKVPPPFFQKPADEARPASITQSETAKGKQDEAVVSEQVEEGWGL